MLLMVFQRPRVAAAAAVAGPAVNDLDVQQNRVNAAQPDGQAQASQSQASQSQAPPQAQLLSQIIERLERLERQDHAPMKSSEPADATVLTERQLQALPQGQRVTTAEAARLLGHGSAVGLSSFLCRHHYALGLVKRGVSDQVAVYGGVDAVAGNRHQHSWPVVSAAAFSQV